MPDEYRCPNCDSTDLVDVKTDAIANELMECRCCGRLCEVRYAVNGTRQLVPL
jgi:transcription elongation factor Elf1